MCHVKFIALFIIFVITANTQSEKLKCYECKNDSELILPCTGFQPNSTYVRECESELADLCYTIVKYNGSGIEIQERSCGGYIRSSTGNILRTTYTRTNILNEKMDTWKKVGYEIVSVQVQDASGYTPDCTRNQSLLETHTEWQRCPCKSDLCNSVEKIGVKPENQYKKCYQCSKYGLPCSGFQANSTYQVICDSDSSMLCFSTFEFHGSNWAVTEKGCANLIEKDNKSLISPHRKGQNQSVELEEYEFSSQEHCGRNENLLKNTCACSTDLCNGTPILPQIQNNKLKCYECTDDSKSNLPSCKGFKPNSTYEIECESDLCLSILEFHDSKWEIRGRGCGAYMKRDGKTNLMKFTKENIESGYQLVSVEIQEASGYIPDCSGNESLLATDNIRWCHCRSDLCNSVERTTENTTVPRVEIVSDKPIIVQSKSRQLTCYECSDTKCLEFQEIICHTENPTLCFTKLGFDGKVIEKGCASLIKRVNEPMIIPQKSGQNSSVESQGYRFVSRDYCRGNTTETCACNSSLCNSGIGITPTRDQGNGGIDLHREIFNLFILLGALLIA